MKENLYNSPITKEGVSLTRIPKVGACTKQKVEQDCRTDTS